MTQYIMRLDDACEKRDIAKWDRMEILLEKYSVKPLVGVIPKCEDPKMTPFLRDISFWGRVEQWRRKGWEIALHGYNHVYGTESGGINPVNGRSEFAGEAYVVQKEKITTGLEIMHNHGFDPKVFFAPAHTFDGNTLKALKECSNIRIISDTIANDIYYKDGFVFVPQQVGHVRRLPLRMVTFCYHPNVMKEKDFKQLEEFLINNKDKFVDFPICENVQRKLTIFDHFLAKMYFGIKRIRSKIK